MYEKITNLSSIRRAVMNDFYYMSEGLWENVKKQSGLRLAVRGTLYLLKFFKSRNLQSFLFSLFKMLVSLIHKNRPNF